MSDAQNMVGQDITEVTVAFGGGEVTSIRTKGMVSLAVLTSCYAQLDIERVIEAAQGCSTGEPKHTAHDPGRVFPRRECRYR